MPVLRSKQEPAPCSVASSLNIRQVPGYARNIFKLSNVMLARFPECTVPMALNIPLAGPVSGMNSGVGSKAGRWPFGLCSEGRRHRLGQPATANFSSLLGVAISGMIRMFGSGIEKMSRPMAFWFMFEGQEASPWATSNRELQFPVISCHLRNDPDVRIRNRKKEPVEGLLDYIRRTRGIASGNRQPRTSVPC